MIQAKVEDGKYECIVEGEPALIAAEMVIKESKENSNILQVIVNRTA